MNRKEQKHEQIIYLVTGGSSQKHSLKLLHLVPTKLQLPRAYTLSLRLLIILDKGLSCWHSQKISELLEWRFSEASLPPELRCQETVCFQQTVKSCLQINESIRDINLYNTPSSIPNYKYKA